MTLAFDIRARNWFWKMMVMLATVMIQELTERLMVTVKMVSVGPVIMTVVIMTVVMMMAVIMVMMSNDGE